MGERVNKIFRKYISVTARQVMYRQHYSGGRPHDGGPKKLQQIKTSSRQVDRIA